MRIIEIAPLENGAHRNQDGARVVPAGWAVIPGDMVVPGSFPFVGLEVTDGVVTSITAREVPEEPEAPEAPEVPTQLDRVEAQVMYTAMMTDTLLEEE